MKSLTGAKFRVHSTDPTNPYDREFISEEDGIYIFGFPRKDLGIQLYFIT